MKQKIIWFLMVLTSFSYTTTLAQEKNNNWVIDSTDRFNNPHCPFDDGLTMWVLKQKYTIDALQVFVENEIPLEDSYNAERTRFHMEVFLPVFKYKSVSSMLGASYNKMYTLTENDSLNQTLYDVCNFWLPIQFNLKNWKITLLYEQFYRSNRIDLYSDIGKTERYFFMAGYAFSLKWQVIIFGAYLKTQMVNKESSFMIPAFQIRFEPSQKLKLTFGAPVLYAMEWKINNRFDFYINQLMLDETTAFLRYNISKKVGISIHYELSNRSSSDAYFKHKSLILNDTPISYSKLTQYQNSISLKIGVQTFKNIGLIISGGYNIGNKIKLYNDETEVATANGESEFFIGLGIQYLKYL